MNIKEDDLKNIINEKDIIIKKLNEKIKTQEIIINDNKKEIYNLKKEIREIINDSLSDLNNKINSEKNNLLKKMNNDINNKIKYLIQILNYNIKIPIIIQNLNEKIYVDINPFERVDIIINKIKEKKGITTIKQHLLYEKSYLNSNCYPADYNIKKNAILDLKIGTMQIFIKDNNLTRPLWVESSDTIKKVIEKIKYYFNPSYKSKLFSLFYNGNRLSNENNTLSDYRIKKENSILLIIN